jgi:Zn ribbon nucleic-acid-binding protein
MLPVPPFNTQPVLAMWDEDIRVDIKCLHCSILFHWTSQAIQHWSSERHLQMIDFLNGEPMMYCVVCN